MRLSRPRNLCFFDDEARNKHVMHLESVGRRCTGVRRLPIRRRIRSVIDVDGPLIVDEMRLAAAAARNGVRIAHVFRQFVEENILSGKLQAVLEKFSPKRGMFHVYYPSSRQLPSKLRVFIDHIRDANSSKPK